LCSWNILCKFNTMFLRCGRTSGQFPMNYSCRNFGVWSGSESNELALW
jgi:hypothetical protein